MTGRGTGWILQWLFLLGLSIFSATAQTRIHDHNLHGWMVYAGDHPVSDRWGIHLEGQWRRHDAGVRPQQILLRPAINYQLTRNVGLSGGYGYITTHRYGEFPAPTPFPEHRIYQQATFQHKAGRLDFQHRFRLEQRWIGQRPILPTGEPGDRTWRYQNRFRYMLRLVVPLKPDSWYFASSDEIFLNLRPTQGARVFDQNRAFVGIGRPIAKDTRLEFGYMQQSVLQRNARILELNHTLHVAVYSRLPFGR